MSIDAPTLAELRARTSAKWRAYPSDVIPAFVAEMDFTLAEPIARVLHAAIDNSDTGYRWAVDVPTSLARFAHSEWAWTIDESRVLVLPDVVTAIAEALQVFTVAGNGVVITSPVYPPFRRTIETAGDRVVVDVPLLVGPDGHSSLDLDGLDAAFARPEVTAFILCSPHNPSGTVPSRDELRFIAESALRHGVAVIADEIHAPLTHPGVTHVPFLTVAPPELTAISLISASKAWNLAGLKCSQLVANNAEVLTSMSSAIPEEVLWGTGNLGVLATIAAYDEGGPWLREARGIMARNAAHIGQVLAQRLPQIGYAPPVASYLAWLDCRALGLDRDPSVFFLEQARVALNSGPTFGRQTGEGFTRLNFATGLPILDEILDRMVSALRS